MASLNMQGSYDLTQAGVNNAVTRTSAGNYGLGDLDSDNTFIVQYVGRSDTDVNSRLKNWASTKYKKFKYSYAASAKAAFEKECQNYHDFGGSNQLDNDVHPACPDGTNWRCPVCNA